jgi:hypothetical protein
MLASVVIKIEYRRVLHQDPVGILRKRTIPSFPATKESSISCFAAAFLPGSAQYVECDVTHSKQSTATFLPGATTAPRGFRQGTAFYPELRRAAVPSLVSSIQFHCSFRAGSPARAFACTLDPATATVDFSPFLTGSASQTESSVTHSKQTTETFLTGARTAIKQFRFSLNFSAQSSAHAAESATKSRPDGRS